MSSTLVHLVYIHGFQGNDTTFQSFPTDLQRHLSGRIPSRLRIQSSIYPTYKSVKPISFATRNFLEWLTTQPPGPVILLGHSMGGLLAADAATDPSNTAPRRIIGMIAFDTPYLGMHPHVVVSGLASLFSKDKDESDGTGKGKPADATETKRDLNDESQVKMIDDEVTDDWEAFKKGLDARNRPSYGSRSCSQFSYPPPTPSTGLSPAPTPSTSLSPAPTHSPPSPFIDRTLSFLSDHSNDPLVRWFRKHPDISSSKRWVVERFQFGICMFDPKGLKERYGRLVAWDGGWVNYWTETISRPGQKCQEQEADREDDDGPCAEEQVADNDVALLEAGMAASLCSPPSVTDASDSAAIGASDPPTLGARTKSEAKAAQKAADRTAKAGEKSLREAEKARGKALKRLEKERNHAERARARGKASHARHFVVLPTGLGLVLGGWERWEKVPIGGVEDEVDAHTGLFIRGQNMDYEALVDRVGRRILGWCEGVR